MNRVFGKLEDLKRAKEAAKRKRDEVVEDNPCMWHKRSVFFRLKYWKDLLVQHNLDVMHIEKNVFDNVVNTLLDVKNKTKDNLASRLDMQILQMKEDLHAEEVIDHNGKKTKLRPASYNLNAAMKKGFCRILSSARFPDGCASSLANKVQVDARKLVGLKSHDCHVIMQQLLPLAIRKILPTKACIALIRLSYFFKQMYSKVIRVEDMERLEYDIAATLCLMEKVFPPSFFDVMVHLCVHLPREAKLAGPVQYQSMWAVERWVENLYYVNCMLVLDVKCVLLFVGILRS